MDWAQTCHGKWEQPTCHSFKQLHLETEEAEKGLPNQVFNKKQGSHFQEWLKEMQTLLKRKSSHCHPQPKNTFKFKVRNTAQMYTCIKIWAQECYKGQKKNKTPMNTWGKHKGFFLPSNSHSHIPHSLRDIFFSAMLHILLQIIVHLMIGADTPWNSE